MMSAAWLTPAGSGFGSSAEVWHLDLVVVGLAAGAVAVVAARQWPRVAARAAAVLAAGYLVIVLGAPTALLAGVAVAAAADRITDWGVPATVVRLLAAALVAVPLLLSGPVLAAATTVAICVAGALGLAPAVRRLPGGIPGPLLLAAVVLAWLCVPDTEETLFTGAALVLPAILAASTVPKRRADRADGSSWLPLLLLLAWAVGSGFRGRPGGTPAIWVVFGGLALWPAALAIRQVTVDRWRAGDVRSWSPALLIDLAASLLAVRTFGLADAAWPGAGWAAALLAGIGVLWWATIRAGPPPRRPV